MFRRKSKRPSLIKDPECTAATKALKKADHEVETTDRTGTEVRRVVAKLKRYGEENNFAEMIKEALGGAE